MLRASIDFGVVGGNLIPQTTHIVVCGIGRERCQCAKLRVAGIVVLQFSPSLGQSTLVLGNRHIVAGGDSICNARREPPQLGFVSTKLTLNASSFNFEFNPTSLQLTFQCQCLLRFNLRIYSCCPCRRTRCVIHQTILGRTKRCIDAINLVPQKLPCCGVMAAAKLPAVINVSLGIQVGYQCCLSRGCACNRYIDQIHVFASRFNLHPTSCHQAINHRFERRGRLVFVRREQRTNPWVCGQQRHHLLCNLLCDSPRPKNLYIVSDPPTPSVKAENVSDLRS